MINPAPPHHRQPKEEGDKASTTCYIIYGRDALSVQLLKVSIGSRNGTPSRKGCVANGHTTQASYTRVRLSTLPPLPVPHHNPRPSTHHTRHHHHHHHPSPIIPLDEVRVDFYASFCLLLSLLVVPL